MSNAELSNEVLVNLIKEGWDPDGKYMMQLWDQNQTLIRSTVKIYQKFESMEDLMQEAFIGFSEAIEDYDPNKDAKFITYALICVKGHVSRYVRKNGSAIRLPSWVHTLLIKKKKFIQEYRVKHDKDPSDQQIAKELEITVERLKELEQKESFYKDLSSLDKPIKEGEDLKLEDCLSDGYIPQEEVEEQIYSKQRAKAVWDEVDQLPVKQKTIILMRYLDDMTLDQCGAAMGINSNAVRAHQIKAIKTLGSGKHRKMLIKYADSDAYSSALRGSVSGFMRSFTSSTEKAAIRNIERHRSALNRIAAFIQTSEEENEKH